MLWNFCTRDVKLAYKTDTNRNSVYDILSYGGTLHLFMLCYHMEAHYIYLCYFIIWRHITSIYVILSYAGILHLFMLFSMSQEI